MYGLALCLPSVGQPQGLPVPYEIPKTQNLMNKTTGLWLQRPLAWAFSPQSSVGLARRSNRRAG
ncbi:MAG: hypothetical protein V9G20_26025 [Candidatus Promineifilaceae bacterium]